MMSFQLPLTSSELFLSLLTSTFVSHFVIHVQIMSVLLIRFEKNTHTQEVRQKENMFQLHTTRAVVYNTHTCFAQAFESCLFT